MNAAIEENIVVKIGGASLFGGPLLIEQIRAATAASANQRMGRAGRTQPGSEISTDPPTPIRNRIPANSHPVPDPDNSLPGPLRRGWSQRLD